MSARKKRMERILIISSGAGRVEADITDENPKTADTVLNALPIEGKANRWGGEIYFSTPIKVNEENSRTEVAIGDLAYWPPGKAISIFFGATPASEHDEPRAYSPVNVFAKIVGDATIFKKVRDGEQVTLRKT